jgi:hypothetical protein
VKKYKKIKMKKIAGIVLSLCAGIQMEAQTTPIAYTGVEQSNAWVFYTGNHKITEKLGIHTEYQWRRNDLFNKWMQSQIRVGLDFNFSKVASTSFGYSFVKSMDYGKFADETNPSYNHYEFNEHRIWQQFITKQQIGRFYTQNRFRLEQRWIEYKKKDATGTYVRDNETLSPGTSEPFRFRQRARYRFMVQIPLNHKEMVDNTVFLQVSDEVFVNFGGHVTKNIFDQNRAYIALGYRFNHHCNLQLGYMNQFIEKSDGVHKEDNHTLQVAITYNLDFMKMFKKSVMPAH